MVHDRATEATNDIRKDLQPISPVYRGHPVLAIEASRCVLANKPITEIQTMCRQLNTNIDGLMNILESEKII